MYNFVQTMLSLYMVKVPLAQDLLRFTQLIAGWSFPPFLIIIFIPSSNYTTFVYFSQCFFVWVEASRILIVIFHYKSYAGMYVYCTFPEDTDTYVALIFGKIQNYIQKIVLFNHTKSIFTSP